LAIIVYVWKFVSQTIGLLLVISFLRCAKWNVWELFSGAEQSCTCETAGAIWDSQTKTCKDASGNAAGPVKTCTCTNGYAWDGGEKGKKQCVPVTDSQPPVAPPAENPVAAALTAETAAAKEAEAKIVPTPTEEETKANPNIAGGDVMGYDGPAQFGNAEAPAGCYPRDQLTPAELLPKDSNSVWAQQNPMGTGSLKGKNFLSAGALIGVNTVGQSMRNANLQLRSEPPNPQVPVSIFNVSTIEPDINRRPLEIS
jgi:hypothetical protein